MKTFWKTVESMIQLMEPFVNTINFLKGDKPIIHEVYLTAKHLKLKLNQVVEKIDFENPQEKNIIRQYFYTTK